MITLLPGFWLEIRLETVILSFLLFPPHCIHTVISMLFPPHHIHPIVSTLFPPCHIQPIVSMLFPPRSCHPVVSTLWYPHCFPCCILLWCFVVSCHVLLYLCHILLQCLVISGCIPLETMHCFLFSPISLRSHVTNHLSQSEHSILSNLSDHVRYHDPKIFPI